jgi:hypothetical protein
MCEKCRELDRQIAGYHEQIRASGDMQKIQSLQAEVRRLTGQKISFHAKPAS